MSVQTLLPSGAMTDGTANGSQRVDGYNDTFVLSVSNKEFTTATEGSRLTAVNPTAGTGIIGHAAPTTFDETKPYLYVYNGTNKTVYPQLIRLTDTVVSVGDTRVQFNVTQDLGNRYSSGGTALTVNATNSAATAPSGLIVQAGAVVLAAATSSRRLYGNYVIRGGVIDVVWDVYNFTFGATDAAPGAALRVDSTTACNANFNLAPMGVAPGWGLCVYQWAASQSTGPTYEVYFDLVAR